MSYKPIPIDTSEINLASELMALTERLAQNVHDQWAMQRLAEGWRYGLRRDPQKLIHPCLVPYAELPDSEKEYDRHTALETIKAIMALGYDIQTPGQKSPESEKHLELYPTIADLAKLDIMAIHQLWQGHQPDSWSKNPDIYRILANQSLRLGDPFLAHDLTTEALKNWPSDVRLRQLTGLALLRLKTTDRAISVLESLQAEGHQDEETLGLLGRAYKDMAETAYQPDIK
ncbi:MAG: hypothetical protein HQK55_16705, partial [Deltaproteobacteria bacterium]|nr:hypothetical protein [Deltaproteobacteria bacterium]